MRYFGSEDVPRYREHLMADPGLMCKVLTAVASVNGRKSGAETTGRSAVGAIKAPKEEINPKDKVTGPLEEVEAEEEEQGRTTV